jgi:hypothetical protein
MGKRTNALVIAAVVGLAIGQNSPAEEATPGQPAGVKCQGINGCAANASCEVTLKILPFVWYSCRSQPAQSEVRYVERRHDLPQMCGCFETTPCDGALRHRDVTLSVICGGRRNDFSQDGSPSSNGVACLDLRSRQAAVWRRCRRVTPATLSMQERPES